MTRGHCLGMLLGGLCVLPVAPARAVAQTATQAIAETINVERSTSVTQTRPGVRSWLVVDPEVAHLERTGSNDIAVHGDRIGQTLVHVWHGEGRETWRIIVVQPPPPLLRTRVIGPPADGRFRPLRLDYYVRYEHTRTGPRRSQTGRRTTNLMVEGMSAEMDSPHGVLAGQFEWSRFNAERDITLWQAALRQGRVGSWRNFDVAVGDVRSTFSLLTNPGARLRGADWIQRSTSGGWMLEGLWGRQLSANFVGSVLPSLVKSRDAWVSGVQLRSAKDRWPIGWRSSLMYGYGRDRNDLESPWVADVELTAPTWHRGELQTVLGVSHPGETAYTVTLATREPNLDWRVAWRDIDPEYLTVVGPVNQRGERGLLLASTVRPLAAMSFGGSFDVFRDRLFPNLAEPDELNADSRAQFSWDFPTRTTWSIDLSHLYRPGQAFPFNEANAGTTLRQTFTLWRPVTVYGGYQFRDNRTVTSPSLSFKSHVLTSGVTYLFSPRVRASTTFDIGRLNESGGDDIDFPRRATVSLDYQQPFHWLGAWTFDSRIAYEDEGRSQATRSFLAGQDRFLLEGGLEYEPVQDMTWFATGRSEWINPERGGGAKQEITYELRTGMRHRFDTPWRWEPRFIVDGLVFHDRNGDGTQQTDEPGLPQVAVRVGDYETSTNPLGHFSLRRRASGRLAATLNMETVPAGYATTTTVPIDLNVTEIRRHHLTFGVTLRTTIRGRLFDDVDSSGTFTVLDLPLGNVRLWLDETTSTTTDGTGWFYFRDVTAGIHLISLDVESLPLVYLPAADVAHIVVTGDKQRTVEVDFPATSQGAVTGFVYVDANLNSLQDPDERGLAGVVLLLDDRIVATTDEEGYYQITGVSPGLHRLELHPEQWVAITPLTTLPAVVKVSVEAPLARADIGVAEADTTGL